MYIFFKSIFVQGGGQPLESAAAHSPLSPPMPPQSAVVIVTMVGIITVVIRLPDIVIEKLSTLFTAHGFLHLKRTRKEPIIDIFLDVFP